MPPIAFLDEFRRSVVEGGAPLPEMTQRLLLDTIGVAGQQVFDFLGHSQASQPEFEAWIVATAGTPDADLLSRFHAQMGQGEPSAGARSQLTRIDDMQDVLSPAQLRDWDENGYVVLPEAISGRECAAVADLVWESISASPDDCDSWYGLATESIMVPVFQHKVLEYARKSPRIHKAFAQLWGTSDLWGTVDRLGFNPPERPDHPFRGIGLHWDVSLAQPIPFATQAVLYLTDTAPDQGAFRCVPGFHREVAEWIDGLGDRNPREVDLSERAHTVPGAAGDLVIWRQDLPHDASPNRSDTPRLVQYINYYSPALQTHSDWI